MFSKTEFKGYDNKEVAKFYEQQFIAAKGIGKSDQYAHEFAAMMVEYYGHQFRQYS